MTRLVLLRHLAAVVILPVTVTILVPVWIAQELGVSLRPSETTGGLAVQIVGLQAVGAGIALFVWSLRRFATDGRGTLAPWDPPKMLVVRGPYQYVRNPMISGVMFVLVGEALVLLSWPHAAWAAMFVVLNLVHIPLIEEPRLLRRFGPGYEVYRQAVPRFFPRPRPWRPRFRERRR
jgi:protein-S-isoprenylcysteine O-methyltransferase Ste14